MNDAPPKIHFFGLSEFLNLVIVDGFVTSHSNMCILICFDAQFFTNSGIFASGETDTCPRWLGCQMKWPVCLRKQRSVLKGTLCWTVPSPKCNAFIISHGHRRCYLGDQLCRGLTILFYGSWNICTHACMHSLSSSTYPCFVQIPLSQNKINKLQIHAIYRTPT